MRGDLTGVTTFDRSDDAPYTELTSDLGGYHSLTAHIGKGTFDSVQ